MDDYPTRKHGNRRDQCSRMITMIDTRSSTHGNFVNYANETEKAGKDKVIFSLV